MTMFSFKVARLITLVYHLVLITTRNALGSSFVSPKNVKIQPHNQKRHRKNIRSLTQQNGSSSNNESSSKSSESTADALREKADQLRREVTQFEDGKRDKERSDQLARDNLLEKKRDERLRYSAIIPILKGDGSTEMERVDFQPRMKASALDGTSSSSVILAVQAALPLGIILGEDETFPGAIRVDELVEDGNGAASGVMVGDLLRACTACQVTMEMPTWQIMAGGIGRPKTSRMMFSTDGRPFEEVMEAVGSNRIDPEKRPAWLVLERNEESE